MEGDSDRRTLVSAYWVQRDEKAGPLISLNARWRYWNHPGGFHLRIAARSNPSVPWWISHQKQHNTCKVYLYNRLKFITIMFNKIFPIYVKIKKLKSFDIFIHQWLGVPYVCHHLPRDEMKWKLLHIFEYNSKNIWSIFIKFSGHMGIVISYNQTYIVTMDIHKGGFYGNIFVTLHQTFLHFWSQLKEYLINLHQIFRINGYGHLLQSNIYCYYGYPQRWFLWQHICHTSSNIKW